MKLSERLANRISSSISPGDMGTGWGQFKYIVATWLYSANDK